MFEKMKHMETLEDNTNEELTLISESPLNLNDIKNLSNVVKGNAFFFQFNIFV